MDFPLQYATTRRFTLGTPRNLTIDPTGRRVTFLRAKESTDPVLCLWQLDDGIERLVVDPSTLADLDDLPPAERARRERARESASGIVSYVVDASATRAAFALGGTLFVCELATGQTTALETGPAVFDPRFDPTGRSLSFVSGDSLRLIDLKPDVLEQSATEQVLATDDDPLSAWGRAEFIAAEEMGRSRGHWWSPDGEHLLVTRVDNSAVDQWWIGDPANPAQTPQQVRYPAAGTNNAVVELWLTDRTGLVRQIDWSDAGAFEYLADVVWSDGRPPLLVRQTRDQRTVAMVTIDPLAEDALEVQRVLTDDVWVELVPGSPSWTDEGLLTVEDDPAVAGSASHRRLCLNGHPLSPDGLEVRSIVGEIDGQVVVTASTEPTEQHLVLVDKVSGATQQLTTVPGVHGGIVGGHTIVMSSSSPDRPGSRIQVGIDGPTIEDLGATPLLSAEPHFFGEADQLRSALFLPSDPPDDQDAPLPVLLDPYGGPHAQRVLKTHNAHLVSQWFANQGFAVVVTDGRGTPGRGPAFERAVWGDLAQPVLDDQIEALDRLSAETGRLDLDRVAIRGWSFGGYLAALAALRRPDRIHAAIAGAPVTSWRLYDTHYTERYLGHPDHHPEHYDKTDLILEAAELTRPLLLIHGLADDNVVAAHTLQFSTALLGAGRPHAVLPLSGVTHMTPQQSIAQNLLLVQLSFLRSSLGIESTTP